MAELSDAALNTLFRTARTHSVWLDTPVGDDTLRRPGSQWLASAIEREGTPLGSLAGRVGPT